MPKKKTELLTKMQLAFVGAFEGDGTEAARIAGAKNPAQYAHETLKNKAVLKAIEDKQSEAVKTSGKELGKRLARTDITDSILEDIAFLTQLRNRVAKKKKIRTDEANMLVRATEARTKASMELAELHGFIWNKNINIGRLYEGKTEEELDFFAINGYWPTMDAAESGALRPESRSQDPSKPN